MEECGDRLGPSPPGHVSTSVTRCGRALWPPTAPGAHRIAACSCPGVEQGPPGAPRKGSRTCHRGLCREQLPRRTHHGGPTALATARGRPPRPRQR